MKPSTVKSCPAAVSQTCPCSASKASRLPGWALISANCWRRMAFRSRRSWRPRTGHDRHSCEAGFTAARLPPRSGDARASPAWHAGGRSGCIPAVPAPRRGLGSRREGQDRSGRCRGRSRRRSAGRHAGRRCSRCPARRQAVRGRGRSTLRDVSLRKMTTVSLIGLPPRLQVRASGRRQAG